jgi:hypothetical protein
MGYGKIFNLRVLLFLPYGLLGLFPALPRAIQSICLLIFITTLVYENRNEIFASQYRIFYSKDSVFSSLFFFITIFFLLFHSGTNFEIVYIQPSLFLVLLPVLLPLSVNISIEKKKIFLLFLTIGVLGFFIQYYEYIVTGLKLIFIHNPEFDASYRWGDEVKFIWNKGVNFSFWFAQWGYFYHNITPELFVHSVYLSALLNLFILGIIAYIPFERNIKKILIYIGLIICCLIVLYLKSKVNIIFLISLITYYLLVSFYKNVLKLFTLLLIVLSIVLFSFTIFPNSFNNNKLNFSYIDSERLEIYLATKEIITENLSFGIGAHKIRKRLRDVLNERNAFATVFDKPTIIDNEHSQFIFYMLNGGILNLLSFIVMFGYFIWKFIKNRNSYGVFFVFLILFNSIFESFLNRTWGVFIFSMGFILFYNIDLQKNGLKKRIE